MLVSMHANASHFISFININSINLVDMFLLVNLAKCFESFPRNQLFMSVFLCIVLFASISVIYDLILFCL